MDLCIPEPNSGCWLWLGAVGRGGYGNFKGPSREMGSAHRWAWRLFRGPIPRGEGHHGTCVLHKCDVRVCVNPDHLYLGDSTDNARDRKVRGRENHPVGDRCGFRKHPEVVPRGERHANAKLTDETVRAIRAIGASGARHQDIADRFGVSRRAVGFVLSGKTWRHVL